ncbi:MAG: ribonuclease H-like domain-containing protein [Candidatus Micrarchaeota archaeon]|nr:ribonuclease H-like domain-containing protein [Candidatus Micrarchaeota archaeon]
MGSKRLEGAIFNIDYLNNESESVLRLTVKGKDGKCYEVFDRSFKPYFYLVPSKELDEDFVGSISTVDNGRTIKALKVLMAERSVLGKQVNAYQVFVSSTSHVPKLSSAMSQYGVCYEYDIPFAKRYSVDKKVVPLIYYSMEVGEENGMLFLESIGDAVDDSPIDLNVMCFDIEVYNPLGVPRASKDPVIMISYLYNSGKSSMKQGVITFKEIGLPFVEVADDEKSMINSFVNRVRELGVDVLVGYNSANFDIRYLLERARALKMDFNLSRFEGNTKIENHGLVDMVKIAGIVHVDMYTVVKFISIVGASENILRLNSKTLKNVYEAITKDKKFAVEKMDIFRLWDGSGNDLETLATYNLADAEALYKVYETFVPIMVELSKLTHDALGDVCVSTTGQLVEFMLMHNSVKYNEIIPNKPTDIEMRERLANPIEGAYVKTPEPGIYSNLAMFDFRGLYPSIIIAYNIDPSSVCNDCKEYYESPNGIRFDKKRKSIVPLILKQMIEQRAEVKKAYKKDPDNVFLGSRSQALKIVSNSVYGYLGYPRSRWYSRACAASVTAFGRQYIKESIDIAEKFGLKPIYGDTDSIVALMEGKTKDDVMKFLKDFNAKLPESMELELEDFYKRGVFVGKKTEKSVSGAKKKYALISETGRIKIRGFELVRRDWSRIARDTQRKVLETILNEGDAQKAVDIVKNAVKELRDGNVPLEELAISTQLRKSIDGYDVKSPELGAARKAVREGKKKREDLEGAVISYVITRHGSSISDRAELEEFARDYDADYYINNQVLPATMRILKELNFSEEELKGLGTQRKL